MEDKDYYTVLAMQKWGGSFVSHLGNLYALADPINARILKVAFRDYFEEYKKLGEKIAEEVTKDKEITRE